MSEISKDELAAINLIRGIRATHRSVAKKNRETIRVSLFMSIRVYVFFLQMYHFHELHNIVAISVRHTKPLDGKTVRVECFGRP